jgi:hypothetical protein
MKLRKIFDKTSVEKRKRNKIRHIKKTVKKIKTANMPYDQR